MGMLTPQQIVKESLRILREKCETFVAILDGSSGETDETNEETNEMEDDIATMLS